MLKKTRSLQLSYHSLPLKHQRATGIYTAQNSHHSLWSLAEPEHYHHITSFLPTWSWTQLVPNSLSPSPSARAQSALSKLRAIWAFTSVPQTQVTPEVLPVESEQLSWQEAKQSCQLVPCCSLIFKRFLLIRTLLPLWLTSPLGWKLKLNVMWLHCQSEITAGCKTTAMQAREKWTFP